MSRLSESPRSGESDGGRPPDVGGLPDPITHWYEQNKRDLPWRREGFTAWGTLVSEFMLQQTPVTRVIPILEEWLTRWPTPADLAGVPAGEAVRAWKSLGYPRRALWLHACAVTIRDRHEGVVPEKVDELLALPGVGEYTARAVAVFAYGRRHPVVDTNVRRVIARAVTGHAESAPPNAKRDHAAMEAVLPVGLSESAAFNAAIMELGATVCTARSPHCESCPIEGRCAWRQAGYPHYTGPRQRVQARYEGSVRQVRGVILAELRSRAPVTEARMAALWPDPDFRARALSGLIEDGLAVRTSQGYALP